MTPTTEPSTRTLPVSSMASVAAHTRGLLREHRTTMTKVVGLHALAATAALAAPRLVGDLVDAVTTGTTRSHIDTLSARFVLQPTRFDVVVATNLFGDILSDLGPACTGTIGLAPSANLNPERKFPSLFEPVHGSAPDIYGQNIANPVAMIWSGALMLEFLGCREAHDAIVGAIERVLAEGPRTGDLGGAASTTEVGKAIARLVEKG